MSVIGPSVEAPLSIAIPAFTSQLAEVVIRDAENYRPPILTISGPTRQQTLEHEKLASALLRVAADYRRRFDRAVAGDNEALVWLFDDGGFAMFEDEPIRKRIEELRDAPTPDRRLLERIAKAVRKSLVEPRRAGRRPNTPTELVRLVPRLQQAFERCPVRVKKHYRNPAAKGLDMRAISKHVAASVPAELRSQVFEASLAVLSNKPGVSKSFGVDVVAKSLSRSSRWIRSTLKTKRL